jgi:hypothetical protein
MIPMAVAGSALFLLSACGTQNGKGTDVGAPAPAPSSSSSSPAASGGTPASTGCTARATLTTTANRDTVCVTEGGRIDITLDGTTDRPWAPVEITGSALTPTNAGIAIQNGDAVAAYKAESPGKVTLTSSRPLCAKAKPGQMSCKGLQVWTVTVTVKAKA